MSRTMVDLDDEALSLASEELGTKSKVATVNAALRRVANQRAAAHMLELLDETRADLSDEALRGAWRDGGRACARCSPPQPPWSDPRGRAPADPTPIRSRPHMTPRREMPRGWPARGEPIKREQAARRAWRCQIGR